MSIKLSIVFPVLNSHEIVRRQILHFTKIGIPDDVEVILVDDGSDPPILQNVYGVPWLRVLYTHDDRAWTWPIARNLGAREAQGKYLLMADIDYIIPKQAILDALCLEQDRMNFQRQFGILDESGNFTQDIETLRRYGLLEQRIKDRGVNVAAHTNDFVMRKETYLQLGGYREDLIGRPYPQGEDRDFQTKWCKAYSKGEVTRTQYRPMVYMFPNGKFCGDKDYNPFDLFHNLKRV